MFSPGVLEKSASNVSENSPSRTKLSVGVNPLGDDYIQNIRIQAAVHGYNNAAYRSTNELIFPSQVKHESLRNPQKFNSIETERAECQNNLKTMNQYRGVGNFPVVHLKKNAVINKPVKRTTYNEFKIQLPELPFNKFLNHLPEFYSDEKSSTRSVLDVLQDLSRKRIHSKDENEISKRRCKGLGGDTPIDFEAPYKPLFVSKPRSNNVITKDSTTQTQDIPVVDIASLKKDEVVLNDEHKDPRVELRKKLARQNNEIFASLSSSTLKYPIKRQAENINQENELSKKREKLTKKVTFVTRERIEALSNGTEHNSCDSLNNDNSKKYCSLTEKKHKIGEINKISPNKDRLTSIFLEMKDLRSKVNNSCISDKVNEKVDQSNIVVEQSTDKSADKFLLMNKNSEPKNIENPNPNDMSNDSQLSKIPSDNSNADTIIACEKNNMRNIHNASQDEQKNRDTNVCTKNNSETSQFEIPTTLSSAIPVDINTTNLKTSVASTVSMSFSQTPIFSIGLSKNESSLPSKIEQHRINMTDAAKNDFKIVEDKIKNLPDQNLKFMESKDNNTFISPNVVRENVTKEGNFENFKFGVDDKGSQNLLNGTNEKQTPLPSSENQNSVNFNQSNSLFRFGTSSGSSVGDTVNVKSLQTKISSDSKDDPATELSSKNDKSDTAFSSVTSSQNLQNQTVLQASDKNNVSDEQAADKVPKFSFNFKQATGSNLAETSLFNKTNNTSNDNTEDKTHKDDVTKDKSDITKEKDNNAIAVGPVIQPQNVMPVTQFSLNAGTGSNGFSTNVSNSFKQNDGSISSFKFGENTDVSNLKPSDNSLTSSTCATNLYVPVQKPNIFTFGNKSQNTTTPIVSQPVTSQNNIFTTNVFSFAQKSDTTASSTTTNVATTALLPNSSTQTNLFEKNKVSQPDSSASSVINPSPNLGTVPALGQFSFGQGTSATFSNNTNLFGSNTNQNPLTFGVTSTPQNTSFNQPFADNTNKQQSTFGQNSVFFTQPTGSNTTDFCQGSSFSSNNFGQRPPVNQSNIFDQKSSPGFRQSENIQRGVFGQSTSTTTFGSQTPFTFGVANTPTTTSCFSLSPPNTTTSSIFTFSGSSKSTPQSSSNFSFSGTAQSNKNPQSLFTFTGPTAGTFQFGSSTTKETSGFGGTGATQQTFSFETNSTASANETKTVTPVFTFGGSQTASSNTGFNFGTTQSPSVFSFGGSGSSTSSPSKFSFTATSPSSTVFTPGVSPSPSSVPLQGIFSIGSGSTQPRSRSSATRQRRRP